MRKFILIITLVFICAFLYAQADLAITGSVSVVNPPSPLHVGITINVTFSVKNIGNATASNTQTAILISSPNNYFPTTLLRKVSLETLASGATSNNIQISLPVPYIITNDGDYNIIVNLNYDETIPETDHLNNISGAIIHVSSAPWAAQNIPYPIIFVHGYNSNNTTWNNLINSLQNFYGWSNGGNMNFCLNYDASVSTSNKNSDYHDFTDISSLHADDYYTVNFDVNYDGTPYSNSIINESNQSAIAKQGLAIRDAIKHVLAVTGKDKVILVCHSMGGLAAREYLQNTSLFQLSDSKKHVARLITIGTPHGGTNVTDFGVDLSIGVDLQSEAIRDLRTSYFYSYYYPSPDPNPEIDAPGTYLFGGIEDLDYMRDVLCCKFHNADVNCDGNATGKPFAGLNYKSIPADLTYSCIIGTGDLLGGDGIVTTKSANINNYLPVNASVFTLPKTSGFVWHTELTKQFAGIMQGVDEPSNDNITGHAYVISSGQLYYGNITYQSIISPPRDYDSYLIYAQANGNLNIQVYNISTPVYSIDIFNSSNVPVYSIASNGKSYINTDVSVIKGNYYVVLSGIPTADSYKYPYAFKCTYSATTSYCSGTTNLTAASGSFTDGSGNNDYSNNSDCRWIIQPSGAKSITLNFPAFTVSQPGDTVYVYNGGTTTSALLGKFTGSTLPSKVTSTGGTMLVRFSTDAANTAAGWKASYKSVTGTVYCSGTTTLTAASGTFSDGSASNNYGSNSHCSWLITPAGAYSVTLNFLTFNTEVTNDILKVYDGNNNTAPLLGSFSGNTIPAVLTSSGGAMFIEFITNDTVTAAGWSASYTAYIPYSGSGIVKYETWFDGGYKNKISTSIMPLDTFRLTSNIPTTNLPAGLHSFHIRFADKNSKWSSVISQFFVKLPQTSGSNAIIAYEYWFDSNYTSKVTQTITRQETYQLITGINANTLTQGLHSFHIRFKDAGNVWSAVNSQFITKLPVNGGSNTIAAYEYWFDNNYAGKTSQAITATENYQLLTNLSAGTLSQGLHSFHIRFKDAGGAWSSTVSQFVIYTNAAGVNQINRYEYWFDNVYTQRVVQDIASSVEVYTLNTSLSTSALAIGKHLFNIRFRQSNGLWSSVVTKKFTKTALGTLPDLTVPTGTLKFIDSNPLFVYPNPSTGKFAVGIDPSVNAKELKVYDGIGNIVYKRALSIKMYTVEVDLGFKAQGTYYVEVNDGKKKYSRKVVIVR